MFSRCGDSVGSRGNKSSTMLRAKSVISGGNFRTRFAYSPGPRRAPPATRPDDGAVDATGAVVAAIVVATPGAVAALVVVPACVDALRMLWDPISPGFITSFPMKIFGSGVS